MGERVTPKYLTAEVAEIAAKLVLNGIFFNGMLDHVLNKRMGHIVVLVPSVDHACIDDYSNWPNYPLQPVVLFEKRIGDKNKWQSSYDVIALNKARQLWYDQNTDGNTDSMSHLLFPGDTPYWGGVKRHGIVVACSGVQAYFDQMISGMIADAIKAIARFNWENSTDKAQKNAFLS
jgi:hypothetical protein